MTIAWHAPRLPRAAALFTRVADYAAWAEGFTHGELSLVVVTARMMARLHAEYAGQPGPTDVLTFDLGSDRRRGRLDAEIVVCTDVAWQQVQSRRGARRPVAPRAVHAELALYIVHGLLHLAGHDDHTAAGYARMHAREDALLTALRLGPVFSAAAAGS